MFFGVPVSIMRIILRYADRKSVKVAAILDFRVNRKNEPYIV